MRCALHANPEPGLCKFCAAADVERRQRNRRIVVGAALLGVIGAITLGLTRIPRPPPVVAAPREADDLVRLKRERLAELPCDPRTNLTLVERLIELSRFDDARVAAEASIQRCGVIGQMKWRLTYANQQLRRWQDVTRLAGELIAADPEDSDFWWWRGEGWADGNQPRAALADYRQSLALSRGAQGAQFAANRLLGPARAANALCEAARGWHLFTAAGRRPTQEMRDEAAALNRAGTCAAERGTGHAVLSRQAQVTLDGATAAFAVDRALGTTLVSRMFAARAGIVPAGGEHGEAQSGGKLYRGELVQLTLRAGGATAKNVDALITDDLPGDAAGILGLSFLWHFSYVVLPDRVELAPLTSEAL
jgi:hypothetical protein